MDQNTTRNTRRTDYLGSGIVFGLLAGLVWAFMMKGNLALGLNLGTMVGVLGGSILELLQERDRG